MMINKECRLKQGRELIKEVYDTKKLNNPKHVLERTILTPYNEEALTINEEVLNLCPGEAVSYYSYDKVITDHADETKDFPLEYLHSLTPAGLPSHHMKLKKGAVVVLLRNITLESKLCNGTRLIVKELYKNTILCGLLSDAPARGNALAISENDVFIPRIPLRPSDSTSPFLLERRAFPVRLAYAMTINKAQGQTFEKVGIDLTRPVFSHGQFYVGVSRVRSKKNVVVQLPNADDSITANIVFREILK